MHFQKDVKHFEKYAERGTQIQRIESACHLLVLLELPHLFGQKWGREADLAIERHEAARVDDVEHLGAKSGFQLRLLSYKDEDKRLKGGTHPTRLGLILVTEDCIMSCFLDVKQVWLSAYKNRKVLHFIVTSASRVKDCLMEGLNILQDAWLLGRDGTRTFVLVLHL